MSHINTHQSFIFRAFSTFLKHAFSIAWKECLLSYFCSLLKQKNYYFFVAPHLGCCESTPLRARPSGDASLLVSIIRKLG